MQTTYRPSHADFTYQAKYGIRNWKGGGRSSARETIGRVAAGAVAEKVLKMFYGVEIVAWVDQVKDIKASVNGSEVTREQVEANVARCPDEKTAKEMIDRITAARKAGDSLGGVVEAVVRGYRQAGASRFLIKSMLIWRRQCFRCRRARVSRLVLGSAES